MSRHKLVKALDLDEELDDFDGGDDDDYEEDLSPEDKEHLRRGTVEVRDILGPEARVTEKDIEESLYHYYYDVEKTVNYLLNQKVALQSKKSKKKGAEVAVTPSNDHSEPTLYYEAPRSCLVSFSAADFFRDSPWLDIPKERRGEILVEPLHPRGGLVGGASTQDGPPKSKLAALAAARRKKENQRSDDSGSTSITSSVALLEKLGSKSPESPVDGKSRRLKIKDAGPINISSEHEKKQYPNRQLQSPEYIPVEDTPVIQAPRISGSVDEGRIESKPTPAASPSTFARTIFSTNTRPNNTIIEPIHSSCLYASLPQSDTEFNAFAGPSPDDIIIEAQNSKGSRSAKQQSSQATGPDKSAKDNVVRHVGDLSIADAPKLRSKNLDVLNEYANSKPKTATNFVVIGHVDAGKSTLMGRLLHDLNVIDKRTIDKYRKEAEKIGKASFALAWVLDQGTEERARGVTIDIAMNKFETEKIAFTILDAPGHRDFIPNMIAGASQADFAILVIDASTGNFESGLKGQTKEHALLVRSMGVQRVVIAINKLDTIAWSKDRFDEISQQVSAFLTTAGFLPRNISFVPCSGLTGDNIIRKAIEPLAAWYTGPTLISLLESSEPITRALQKPLRLIIDDIFRGGVQNPLSISGRLDAGTIQTGDPVLVMPSSQIATTKGIEVDSESAEWAVAGQNVTLHLADIEAKYMKPGDVICPPSAPIKCVTSFTVKVLAFDHIMPMHCEVHRGRLHAPGRIAQLVAVLDKGSGGVLKGKKPRLIKPGSVARVKVEVEDAVPLEEGGRVILRAGGETIGAGLVE